MFTWPNRRLPHVPYIWRRLNHWTTCDRCKKNAHFMTKHYGFTVGFKFSTKVRSFQNARGVHGNYIIHNKMAIFLLHRWISSDWPFQSAGSCAIATRAHYSRCSGTENYGPQIFVSREVSLINFINSPGGIKLYTIPHSKLKLVQLLR